MRHIDPALLQSLERDLPEWIVADAGLKSDAAAERGQIVRHDRGRRAEREHHAVGKQFAFRRKLLGQAVEDEVEVQFAGDGDVETGHVSRAIGTENSEILRCVRLACSRTRQDDNSSIKPA